MNIKQFTVASCCSSFLLPHVLFLEELEARKKANAEQEEHTERIWQMLEGYNQEAQPPGFEQGFKQDRRTLIAQKHALVP